jgi:hypothetical protein
MKETNTTLTNGHHIAIRVALMQSIRGYFKVRHLVNNRESITDAISALRLIRNSDKLEATEYTFAK